jgi:uncharacterized membrane protein
MYDFLLFVHVLAAFLLVASAVMYSAYALGAPSTAQARFAADRLWDVGSLGTLVFGIWLALYVDGYEIWDGWILAALVLWFVAYGAHNQTRELLTPARAGAPAAAAQSVMLWNGVRVALTVILLLDMLLKPGA